MPDEYISGDELFRAIAGQAPLNQIIIKGVTWPGYDPFDSEYDPWMMLWDLALPYTSKDNYSCYTEEISTKAEMISGRIVKDIRGRVTKIHYKYDYMPPAIAAQLLFILRSKTTFWLYYRPDDDPDNLYFNEFYCESIAPLKYAFASERYENYWGSEYLFMEPKWHGIEFTLRQVDPNSQARIVQVNEE